MLRAQFLLLEAREPLQQVISLAQVLLAILPLAVEAQNNRRAECATEERQQHGMTRPIAWCVRR
jgi:hypothetical protein